MASSRKPKKAKKQISRAHCKKQLPRHKPNSVIHQASPCITVSPILSSSSSSTVSQATNQEYVVVDNNPPPSSPSGGCCTPKSQKSRIPEMLTCPPAPKKQRVLPNYTSLRRRPIAFFAPPDIELFFHSIVEHVN